MYTIKIVLDLSFTIYQEKAYREIAVVAWPAPTNQNNGGGQSVQEKRSSSRVEKKEQLAKVEKMLGSYKLAEEKGDQSILRYSILLDSENSY